MLITTKKSAWDERKITIEKLVLNCEAKLTGSQRVLVMKYERFQIFFFTILAASLILTIALFGRGPIWITAILMTIASISAVGMSISHILTNLNRGYRKTGPMTLPFGPRLVKIEAMIETALVVVVILFVIWLSWKFVESGF